MILLIGTGNARFSANAVAGEGAALAAAHPRTDIECKRGAERCFARAGTYVFRTPSPVGWSCCVPSRSPAFSRHAKPLRPVRQVRAGFGVTTDHGLQPRVHHAYVAWKQTTTRGNTSCGSSQHRCLSAPWRSRSRLAGARRANRRSWALAQAPARPSCWVAASQPRRLLARPATSFIAKSIRVSATKLTHPFNLIQDHCGPAPQWSFSCHRPARARASGPI